MAILSNQHYPAVRAALLLGLSAEMLPDDTVASPIFQQAAEAEIVRCDPTAESRTGKEKEAIERAAIYLTAALIAPSIPNVTEHEEDKVRAKVEAINWMERADDLREKATAELNNVLNPSDPLAQRPTAFTLARGERYATF